MDALSTLVDLLKTGGPYAMSAIFMAVWWAERSDRRTKEETLHETYQQTVTLVRQSTQAINQMQAAINGLRDAIHSLNGHRR